MGRGGNKNRLAWRRNLRLPTQFGRGVCSVLTALVVLLVVSSLAPRSLAAPKAFTDLTEHQVLTGKFRGADNPGFRKFGPMYLRQDTWKRYKALKECAKDKACSGLDRRLNIVTCSMFRGYGTQRNRWLGEMSSRRARISDHGERVENVLRYLAMPGTSRHHWGTDIDIASDRKCMMSNHPYMSKAENTQRCARYRRQCRAKGLSEALCNKRYRFCYKRDGRALEFYGWMRDNAGRFGFCQPYKGFPEERHAPMFTRGYEPERWHWSSCCEARRNYERAASMLDRMVPPLADVFGKDLTKKVALADTLKALHRTLVIDAARQHILNVHIDCLACAADCDAPPGEPSKAP